MSGRIAPLSEADLDDTQRTLYRTLVDGPRGRAIVKEDGSLFGPFNAMLRSPAVGDRLQALGLTVQGPDALPSVVREVVVLSVAARRSCRGEWAMHRPRAVAAGAPEPLLEAIERGGPVTAEDPRLAAALELADAQLRHVDVPDDAYTRAVDVLGERHVFEVCALVGYYDGLCSLFTLFHIA